MFNEHTSKETCGLTSLMLSLFVTLSRTHTLILCLRDSLEATNEHYIKVAECFMTAMPNASITSIDRIENFALFERYFEVRKVCKEELH